jgi:hypothetical protein
MPGATCLLLFPLPSAFLLLVFAHAPSTFLSFDFFPCPPVCWLVSLPSALLPLTSAPASASASAFLFAFSAAISEFCQHLCSTSMPMHAHAVKCHLLCGQVGFQYPDPHQLSACAVKHAAVCGAELADRGEVWSLQSGLHLLLVCHWR